MVDQLLVTRDRLAGMSDALKLADIVLPKEYILHFDFSRESGQQAVEELMGLRQTANGNYGNG